MSNEQIDVELYINPSQIAKNFAQSAMPKKASYSKIKTLILAIAAGAFIAFGAQGSLTAMTGSDAMSLGIAKLLGGIVFSTGLMMIVFTGSELFTGNILIGISVLEKKVTVPQLLRNWFLVYIGNFIGAFVVALLIHFTNAYHGPYEATGVLGIKVAYMKTHLTFIQALVSGILCNWLVCLAVWMATAAKDVAGKILAILFPITTFAMCGYEHCVANMYMIANGLLTKFIPNAAALSGFSAEQLATLNAKTFLIDNLIPVTIGNILGALIFVVGIFWVAYIKKSN